MILYKVLKDGSSFHGGQMPYSLPVKQESGIWTPGGWHEVEGELVLCENALHITSDPKKWFEFGAQAFEVEHGEETVGDIMGDDKKIGVRKLRLVRQLTNDELAAECDLFQFSEGEHEVSKGLVFATGSASVRATDSASVRAHDSASVRATGSASVRAHGSASVRATDSASVTAYDSASVRAHGSASVTATGSASVRAHGSASVTATGSASVRATGSASVGAHGSASVTATDSASVTAYDSASVTAYDSASVRAHGSASVRATGSASVTSNRYHNSTAKVLLEGDAVHIDRRGKLILRTACDATLEKFEVK